MIREILQFGHCAHNNCLLLLADSLKLKARSLDGFVRLTRKQSSQKIPSRALSIQLASGVPSQPYLHNSSIHQRRKKRHPHLENGQIDCICRSAD